VKTGDHRQEIKSKTETTEETLKVDANHNSISSKYHKEHWTPETLFWSFDN
jgi:hypothetical protein